MTNLERLALLLQRVTGIEAGKTPEETIKRAVQVIKASKNTDQQVKSQLSKVKLSEEEICVAIKQGFCKAHTYIKSDNRRDIEAVRIRFAEWRKQKCIK